MLQHRVEHRLQRDDVAGHPVDGARQHLVVELRRRQSLIQAAPAAIPRFELGVRQLRLDLEHVAAEERERGLVVGSRAFEVEADLQASNARVVPGLEMEVRAFVQ